MSFKAFIASPATEIQSFSILSLIQHFFHFSFPFAIMIILCYCFSSSASVSLHLIFLLVISFLFARHCAQPSTTAYGGTTWRNNPESLHLLTPLSDDSSLKVRTILLTPNISYNDVNMKFGCGFFCDGINCNRYLFSVFFAIYDSKGLKDVQIVWSANRNRLVKDNATLRLSSTGDLQLRESDGTLVWSTNTFTQHFTGMRIEESGNFLLFNNSNGTVWQSFDHPTDTLLKGQKLMVGQKLIANMSPNDTSEGIFYATLLFDGLGFFTATAPSHLYFRCPRNPTPQKITYMEFDNDWLYAQLEQEGSNPAFNISVPKNSLFSKIDFEGHFQFYSIRAATGRSITDYLTDFTNALAPCDYPRTCGDYGICTDGQCSCPKGAHGADDFSVTDSSKPNSGCLPPNPLVCSETSPSKTHHFLELEHVSYFTNVWERASIPHLITRDECKYLCLNNCSCKAAFLKFGFTFNANFTHGHCYLESVVYSVVMNNNPTDSYYNSTAYFKIQSTSKRSSKRSAVVISGAAVSVAFFLLLLLWVWKCKCRKATKEEEEDPETSLVWLGSLPKRHTNKDLQKATDNFKTKLGSGGFGSVFEGVLCDGTKIAVKRLDRAGQGKKEFRAEVETLGSIQHLYLVRLKGFCAEKSHRMLVYEYLPNGSLDKWIFPNRSHQHVLDWKTRSKVAAHIARGLAYLHEECGERVIHFDIKPQNILLDENFNAKVSDFGLAKLINRDQSEVITIMRGTPGYMAPEWLNMHVTEKADIYSYGVVLLEIVSGRRSRDLLEPEYSLRSVLQHKSDEGRLMDLIDPRLTDEGIDIKNEALKMIDVAMWCVCEDFTRRPAMSTVVKILEGTTEMDEDRIPSLFAEVSNASSQLLECSPDGPNIVVSHALTSSVLSGPR